MKLILIALSTVMATSAFAQGWQATYPCLEYSTSSTCAKAPFLPPQPTSTNGIEVKCEIKGGDFSSLSTQPQEKQLSCLFGQCKPAGYGFIWYLTRRTLSSKDAPRIYFLTQDFVKDSTQLESQEVVVTFNASQAFFDYAEDDKTAGIRALNDETKRMNTQQFKATIKDLLVGFTRPLTVGVLAADKSIQHESAELSCSARRE